jgi:glucokinase
MKSYRFIDAYLAKGRMQPVVERIAVNLVTNDSIGVLGALSAAATGSR